MSSLLTLFHRNQTVALEGNVASVQPFEATIATGQTSGTDTLDSAVDPTKSVIFWGGFTSTDADSTANTTLPRVALTNGTTVTASRNTSDATDTVTVRGTVVEFTSNMVESVEYGTITIDSGVSSNTATLFTSVTTAHSVVMYLGYTNDSAGDGPNQQAAELVLTNGTTVTATRHTTGTSTTIGFCVVQFKAAVISSIQARSVTQATTSLTFTDTITAVDTTRTILLWNGVRGQSGSYLNWLYGIALTNGTTVTGTRQGLSSLTRTLKYTVIEFAAGVLASVQRDSIALADATSADDTITSVDTTKAVCNWLGHDAGGGNHNDRDTTVKLQSATAVRGQKNSGGGITTNVSYEVVQFT